MEATRQLVGKRARGVGKLRPSVVLYNEMHRDGEGVGEVVRRDLVGGSRGKGRSGADLLLVVGTSLRVPGTKRIVREFAKAVHSRTSISPTKESLNTGLQTPSPSPRRSPATDEEPPMKTVYLNLDFPVPTREWEGVFDVWLQGDAQKFAEMLGEEIEQEARAKQLSLERKRKREEEAAITALKQREAKMQAEAEAKAASMKGRKKRNLPTESSPKAAKRRKMIPSPRSPLKSEKGNAQARVVVPALTSHREDHQHVQSKIILRIPARPNSLSGVRQILIPEVYISTPPPSAATFKNPYASQVHASPTPARSAHAARQKINLRTKAGRKAARAARIKQPGVLHQSLLPESGQDDVDTEELTDSQTTETRPSRAFLRNVQYGLRGS